MIRLFVNASLQNGNLTVNDNDTINHIRATRLRPKDNVILFNGTGDFAKASIDTIERKLVNFIVDKVESETISSKKICLAIGLIANDKMDIIVQKAVELGVGKIIPIYTNYSQRISSERIATRMSHWQKIIISSCEQCGQNILPGIIPPITLSELLDKHDSYEQKIVLNFANSNHFKLSNTQNSILIVGPEGGLTNSEINLLHQHNYKSMQLGSLVLRSETAAITGLSLINFGNF